MEPKKPPRSGEHPSTQTVRTERPVFDGDSEKVDRPQVFQDEDTFLDERKPLRRPLTAELSVIEAQDIEHQSDQTDAHPTSAEGAPDGSGPAAELHAFGEGALLEDAPGHITEVLEGPGSPSRERSAAGRAAVAAPQRTASKPELERWSAGTNLPPTTRAGGGLAHENLPTVDVEVSHRLVDEAIELVRAALVEAERFDGGAVGGASAEVRDALEHLLAARAKLTE